MDAATPTRPPPREIPAGTLQALQDERAVRSLRHYLPLVWVALMTGTPLVRGWYLDAIADHLDALKRFLMGQPGAIQRLLISVIFRSGKSTYLNVGLPTWLWLHDPTIKILSGSHDQTLSTRDTWASRRLIEHPTYQRLLAHQHVQRGMTPWAMAGDQNVKSFYANTAGGWRMGTQVGAGTGQGGRLILIDDPLSIDGAQSEAKTEEANEWLWKTVWSRQDDPKGTAMGIAAHRTREDDPIGTAIAKDLGFEYLKLPIEYDPATRQRATIIMHSAGESPTEERWTQDDPRTVAGESMEPRRWPRDVIAHQRAALGDDFEALANQNPQKSGKRPIRPEMIFHWRELPRGGFKRITQTWDTSFRGEDPTEAKRTERSQTAGFTLGWTETHCYILDRDTRFMDIDQQMDAIEAMLVRWKKRRYTLIEAKANGDAILALLGKKWRGLVPIDPGTKSKYLRLMATLQYFRAGNVLLPPMDLAPWVPELVKALLRFPGKPDDDVDALTQALRYEWLPDLEDFDMDPGTAVKGAASIRALSR